MALKQVEYKDSTLELSYDILNNQKSETILFLHGWGSNKEVMKMAFSGTLKEFRHIYLDLPGFGKSTNDKLILTTYDYFKIVEEFLQKLDMKSTNLTIAGHSYGGKVATLLNPKNLVLLSSAGIVEEKSNSVKLKIILAKILNKFGLRGLTKAFRSKDVEHMSQNMYETFKNVVNEDFSKYFEEFSNKAFIFWGEQDSATTLQSGEKIAKLIKNSKFFSYSGDHYFFLEHKNDIAKVLEDGIL